MRVMFSVRDIAGALNPYVPLLANSLEGQGIEVLPFDRAMASRGKVDILHTHWPEQLFISSSRAGTARALLESTALLSSLKKNQTRVVRTVHNERPHEKLNWVVESRVRALDAITSGWIHLTETSLASRQRNGLQTHIPHGDYKPIVGHDRSIAKSIDFLFFGLIRDYKNLPSLIRAFADTPGDYSLVIAGILQSRESGEKLRSITDSRISSRLERLSDNELAQLIREARVVVLPYADFGNSGSALLALSAGTRVLLPDTPASRELRDEVGDDWVRLYRGALTPEALIASHGELPLSEDGPPFTQRDWGTVGELHSEFYQAVLGQAATFPSIGPREA